MRNTKKENTQKILKNVFIVTIFFLISAFSFAAGEDYSDFKALLVGDEKGNIVKMENENAIRPLASITKVMTSILVLEKINSGEIKMNDRVFVSSQAASIPYGIKLVAGNTYTVRDLLKASIIRSSNNAAYALGEFIGGDTETFVRMMNEKASELGLTSLRFCSAHGLPPSYTGSCMDQGNAKDLYKMAAYAVKFPEYLEISKNANGSMDNGAIALKSTNALLGKVVGVDGLKTGYHNAAGSNIILTAKRNGKRVIVVILGSQKAANRNAIGTEEINNYYNGRDKVRAKVKIPTISATKDKNAKEPKTSTEEITSIVEQNAKVISKTELIGTTYIGKKKYGLYSSDDIPMENGVKSKLKYDISLKENVTKKDLNNIVGTFIATDGENEYIGAVVLREIGK